MTRQRATRSLQAIIQFNLLALAGLALILGLGGCIRPVQPRPLPSMAALPGSTATPAPASPTVSPSETVAIPSHTPVLSSTPAASETPSFPEEAPVIMIPLDGPIIDARAEISGMAWFGDTLILLPQFPERFGIGADGAVFAFSRSDLVDFLDGKLAGPIKPKEIPFSAPGLKARIRGYEGYEAIGFDGNQVFLTIEANEGAVMSGYLVTGTLDNSLSALSLNTTALTRIPPQADIPNFSDESLLIAGTRILTFYEANGALVNPSPVAHLFDTFVQPQGTISFPNIEYRITDSTTPDELGRFWVLNCYFPGDRLLLPDTDPLFEQFGKGISHSQAETVERLVELQFTENGLALTGRPPIQLLLLPAGIPRNWEALARLDGRGFLLATDKFPGTLFGFVPYTGP